jgi:hypothetical protein
MRGISVLKALGAAAVLALAIPTAHAAIMPLPTTGWTLDMVMEGTLTPAVATSFVSATMDAGTGLTGNTWNAQGTVPGSPTSGLPAAGTPIQSLADPNTTFSFQPFNGPNALLLDTIHPRGTLALLIPKPLSSLVLIGASGNGGITNAPITIHFADGFADLNTTYSMPDWFNNTPFALSADGRVDVVANTFNNVGAGNPRLYQATFDLSAYASHPVGSIDVGWNGSGGTHTAIMAVSGQVVPEPAALAIMAVSGLGLLIRRRTA